MGGESEKPLNGAFVQMNGAPARPESGSTQDGAATKPDVREIPHGRHSTGQFTGAP